MNPLICVILVNYNGYTDTKECVESLLQCEYENLKIIIVDNGSTDEVVQYDNIICSDICEIIILEQNIGFAGGNNVGIEFGRKFHPDYYLILNNDTVVKAGFLHPLLEIFQSENTVGIATGKILYYDDESLIWYGGSYYDNLSGEFKIRGIGQKDEKKYAIEQEVGFAPGCLWLLPAEVIDKVGYICEEYFLYYEDADYCNRVKEQGFKIYYQPRSVILHKESRSTGKGSDSYQYYNNRNYLFYVHRYHQTARALFYYRRALRMLKGIIRGNIRIAVVLNVWRDFLFKSRGKLARPL